MARHVQSNKSVPGTLATVPLAFTNNVVAGNVLVVGVYMGSATTTVSSVTDSLGNGWSRMGGIVQTTDGHTIELWMTGPNIASGADTVTANLSISTAVSLVAIGEYSELSTPLPPAVTAIGAANTSVNAGTVVTPEQVETIILFTGGSGSGTTCTGTNGFTTRQTVLNSTFFTASLLDKDTVFRGSSAATATLGSANNWSAVAVGITKGHSVYSGGTNVLMARV